MRKFTIVFFMTLVLASSCDRKCYCKRIVAGEEVVLTEEEMRNMLEEKKLKEEQCSQLGWESGSVSQICEYR